MATLEERFWAKVEPTGFCWEWTAYVKPKGYGVFKTGPNRTDHAHRVSYELLVGPIPEGLELDHLCRNRRCVNPDHLEPVTHAENLRRGAWGTHQARKTHCPKGHEYNAKNTHFRNHPAGYINRMCRVCARDRQRLTRSRSGGKVRA